jgi:hypothetical protein
MENNQPERFLQFFHSILNVINQEKPEHLLIKKQKKEIKKKKKKQKPKLIRRLPPPFLGPEPKRFIPTIEPVAPVETKMLESLKQFKPSVKQETATQEAVIQAREEKPFDFGKLNEIMYRKEVKAVECNGPNQEIIAKTDSGVEKTTLKLSKDEILELISRIASEIKIPITRLFQAYFSNFSMTAVIDDEPKFIIAKL